MTSERTVKCIAVTDFYSDDWCVQNCAMMNCPQDSCVCDWMGTWSEDDTEFASWTSHLSASATRPTWQRMSAPQRSHGWCSPVGWCMRGCLDSTLLACVSFARFYSFCGLK